MKKTIMLAISVGVLTACSSSPKSDNHKINCDKMHLDSQTKLTELQRIFNAYQDVNVDLATKLSGPYKEEVASLNDRITKQKARCWKDEERPIDDDMASLNEDTGKIYGEFHAKPKKRMRSVASVKPVEQTPPAEPAQESDAVVTPSED